MTILQASAVTSTVLASILQIAAAVVATACPVKAVFSVQLESQDVGQSQTVTMSRKGFPEEDSTLHNTKQLSLISAKSGKPKKEGPKPTCHETIHNAKHLQPFIAPAEHVMRLFCIPGKKRHHTVHSKHTFRKLCCHYCAWAWLENKIQVYRMPQGCVGPKEGKAKSQRKRQQQSHCQTNAHVM